MMPRSRRATTVVDDCHAFGRVKNVGLTFPDVDAATRYDGSPVLKAWACSWQPSRRTRPPSPDTLVVRAELETRALLLEDAPETYYVTDYYQPYPVVLARLSRIDGDALHDLLASSWRLSMAKAEKQKGRTEVRPYE
jgi:hypothetical protein